MAPYWFAARPVDSLHMRPLPMLQNRQYLPQRWPDSSAIFTQSNFPSKIFFIERFKLFHSQLAEMVELNDSTPCIYWDESFYLF